jgi:hypothetical protein
VTDMTDATPTARYANAEGTDVLLDLGNGIVQAIKPGDGRLDGLTIAPYEAPPPAEEPPLSQLLADLDDLRARIEAHLAG